MRSVLLRACFGCGSLLLSLSACSSSNDGGGATDAAGNDAGASGGSKTGAGPTAGTAPSAGSGATANTEMGAGGALSNGAGGDGDTSTAQVVGKPGATITDDGVSLVIPANALSKDTPISVTTISAPAGFTPASDTFQFGPDGTTFKQPVAVTIPLKSSTPDAHVFWSNASGGFDDIGGTVSGKSVTANVTHFSIGFAAVPVSVGGSGGAGGDAGASGSGGMLGGSGSGGSDSAGTTGAGGTAGAAGAGGAGGTSGTAGAGGTSGAGGAGGSAGSGGSGGSALCSGVVLNAPFVKVTNTAGNAPDSTGFIGGTLVAGNYYEGAVTHYGASAYGGATQAIYKIDATAMTIQIVERIGAQGYAIGIAYTQTDAHTLHATVVCDTSASYPASFDYDYIVMGTTIVMTMRGSSDVMTL